MKKILTLLVLIMSTMSVFGQKVIDGAVVHGNEWIDYNKTYFKISLDEDGIYKVTKSELDAVGFPTDKPMSAYKLIHVGQEVPIQTSTNAVPAANDYFLFLGKKNTFEVDRYVYENDDMMLNPKYSVVSDQSAYFLTIDESASNLRYNETTSNVADASFENYLWTEKTELNGVVLQKNKYRTGSLYESVMDLYEGYASSASTSYSNKMTLDNYVEVNKPSDIYFRSGVQSKYELATNIVLTVNGTEKVNNNFTAKDLIEFDGSMNTGNTVDVSLISNTSIGFDNKPKTLVAVPYYTVTYTRDTNIGSLTDIIALKNKATDSGNYAITTTPDVKVLVPSTNEIITTSSIGGGKYAYNVTASDYVLFSEAVAKTPTLGNGRQYTDYSSATTDYVIITHPDLNSTGSVDNYAAYRASELGDSYTPLIVDITELYDQYAYGVDTHFASIRNFANKVKGIYDPKTLFFLIGDGVQYPDYRKEEDRVDLNQLVPTFGYPTSDTQLFCDFESDVNFFGYGRLSAITPSDVDAYLAKIQTAEQAPQAPWMKNVLHLSGGTKSDTYSDYKQVEGHLEYAAKAFDVATNDVGADLTTLYKHETPNVIQTAEAMINDGQSIVTFFGHGSVDEVDFNISTPDTFTNEGKLPLVMALGCNAGNCCDPDKSMAEQYVLEPETGAAVFIATTGSSFGADLEVVGYEIYDEYGHDYYGQPIGHLIQKASADAIAKNNAEVGINSTIQQLSLQGDPAFSLYTLDNPDYTVDFASANANNNPVYTITDDTVEFCVDISNKGLNANEDVSVLIELKDEAGEVIETVTKTVTMNAATVNVCHTFTITDLLGEYRAHVAVNQDNTKSESTYDNNILVDENSVEGYPINICSDSIKPIYPEEFSIVNTVTTTLVATAQNPLVADENYTIQLDTVPSFDSGYLLSQDVPGTPAKLDVSLLNNEDQVYYWRVKSNSCGAWESSSFVYNSTAGQGWNQSHYGQYAEDTFTGLFVDEGNLNFEGSQQCFKLTNRSGEMRLFLNTNEQENKVFVSNDGYSLVLINPRGKAISNNKDGKFGSLPRQVFDSNGNRINSSFFDYPDTAAGRNALISAINNKFTSANGASFFVLSNRQTATSEYDNNSNNELLTFLRDLGALRTEELATAEQHSYIVGFTNNGGTAELIGESISEVKDGVTQLSACLQGVNSEGEFTTPLIGTGNGYTKLIWDSSDNLTQIGTYQETYSVDVIGVDANGSEIVIKTFTAPGEYDLSDIDATAYPNLRLKYTNQDNLSTAAFMDMIRVVYEGAPDLVLEKEGAAAAKVQSTDAPQIAKFDIDNGQHLGRFEINDAKQHTVQVSNYSSYDAVGTYDVRIIFTSQSGQRTQKSLSFTDLAKLSTQLVNIDLITTEQGLYDVDVIVNYTNTKDAGVQNFAAVNGMVENEYSNNVGNFEYQVGDVLPVEFGSFTVENEGDDVLVSWTTVTEINNSHFDVQRSFDGTTFEIVGTVQGNGNSTEVIEYSFVDYGVNNGNVVYYRLVQNDFDGQTEVSSVESVRFTKDLEGTTIFPNPARDVLNVVSADASSVEIYNTLGVLVATKAAGSIDISQFESGSYIINVLDATNNVIANETIIIIK